MKKYIFLQLLFFGLFFLTAKDNTPNPTKANTNSSIIASGCLPSTSEAELSINNVRTTILGGGDMWWNLNDGKYEIPKNSGRNSMFAGALWIGGLDDQENLKVAAMTYRQDGSDFWPGPLNSDVSSENYGTTNQETCFSFDKHWSITKNDVIQYQEYIACLANPFCNINQSFPNYLIPPAISEWPGIMQDADGNSVYLAPFNDVNNDGDYTVGIDYPEYNLNGELNCLEDDMLWGDQTIWWVFNDNGNTHTETGSESAIGIEIQAQAFAFNTSDAINDMTFYSYKIINRSSFVLNEAYFGQWVDPDLGNYQDDYVGCDVSLGLGYCYNGDADDDGVYGYNYDSDDPPPAIGVDFFRGPLADTGDGVDNDRDGEIDEEGEQIIMSNFVYYNNDFSDFGNPENATHYYGYLKGIWKNGQPMTYGGTGWESSNPECNFMFPDDTDPDFSPLYGPWTEITAGNDPADRRFLQSAGPFTLEPGAVNYIKTGVVWARADASTGGDNFTSIEVLKEHDQLAQSVFDACFDPSEIGSELFGCTNETAINYDSTAIYNDYSCLFEGCMNVSACNYDPFADYDDGSCEYCYYYSTNYPLVAVFNSTSIPELLSTGLGPDVQLECFSPGDTCKILSENAFLIENMDMETFVLNEGAGNNNWISPIPDIDRFYNIGSSTIDIWLDEMVKFMRPQDWVRSGTNIASSNIVLAPFNYYSDISVSGYPMSVGTTAQQTPLDPDEIYEFNRTPWLVPYMLTSSDYKGRTGASNTTNVINFIDTIGGGLAWSDWRSECDFDDLMNVDVVLTSNKDLWTRCPVLDMSERELEWIGQGSPVDQSNGVTWPFGTSPSSSSYPWATTASGAVELTPTGENGESKWDLRLDMNVDKDGNPDGSGENDKFNSENGWGWFPGYAINTDTGQRLNMMFSENSSLGEQHNANDMLYNPTAYIFDFGLDNEYFQTATTMTMNGGHAVFVLDTEYQGDNLEDNPHYSSYTGSSENNAWNSLRKKQVIPHIQWVGNWLGSETEDWLSSEITIQARIEGTSSELTMNENCECSDNNSSLIDNQVDSSRKLIKVVDILGRNTDKKGFQLHIYDDGSFEKKYLIK